VREGKRMKKRGKRRNYSQNYEFQRNFWTVGCGPRNNCFNVGGDEDEEIFV